MSVWDDIGSVLGGAVQGIGQALPAVQGYLNQQMQMKQAKKLAKAYGPMGAGLMNFSMGLGPQQPGPYAGTYSMPSAPAGSTSPVTDVLSYLGFAGTGAGAAATPCSLFKSVPSGMRYRAISLVTQEAPDGSTHYWRHVGRPVLFSGDVSHCRRVNKILGRARRGGRARRKSY
jgi:hypothetical protein